MRIFEEECKTCKNYTTDVCDECSVNKTDEDKNEKE